eukprot:scaffold100979_cov48-Phaeocystis_antarctica.AAC.3
MWLAAAPLVFYQKDDAKMSLHVIGPPPSPPGRSNSSGEQGVRFSMWENTECKGESTGEEVLLQADLDNMYNSTCNELSLDLGSGPITVYESFSCDAGTSFLTTEIHKLSDCSDVVEESCFGSHFLDKVSANNGKELAFGCQESIGGPNRDLGKCVPQLESISVKATGNFTCPDAPAWYNKLTSPSKLSQKHDRSHSSSGKTAGEPTAHSTSIVPAQPRPEPCSAPAIYTSRAPVEQAASSPPPFGLPSRRGPPRDWHTVKPPACA